MSLAGIFDRVIVIGTMVILCVLLAFAAFTFERSSQMDVSRSNEVVFASSRLINNFDALRFAAKQATLKDPALSTEDLSNRFIITHTRVQNFKKGEMQDETDPAIQKYIGQLDVVLKKISNTIEDPNCDNVCRGKIILSETQRAKRIVIKLRGRGLVLDSQMRRSVDEFNASTISRIFIGSIAFMAFTGVLAVYMTHKNHALRAQQIQLTESQHRLVEVGRYRAQFLAGMSHEFRTPLNAIKGFAQLITMLKADMPREKLLEYINDIEKSANDLEDTTNSILDLSKVDAGAFDLYEREVDLVEVIEDVKKQFGVSSNSKRLVLETPPNLTAYCDPTAIKRCVQNIVSNALKFSPDDTQIKIALKDFPQGIKIAVTDQGCGIPEEDIESVWKVYSRSSYTRVSDKQGSGLGLPIIKALIEAHGGTVKLESTVGVGTTVIVTLPPSRKLATKSALKDVA